MPTKLTPRARAARRVALATVGLVVFVHTLSTPLIADDYARSVMVRERGIAAIPAISWEIGQELDGRFPDHLTMLTFLALPKPVFALANALVLTALVAGAARLASGRRRPGAGLLVGLAVLLWWCLPDYGQVAVWLTGACNYTWPAAVAVWFLQPYARLAERGRVAARWWWIPVLVVAGFAAGGGSETLGPATFAGTLLAVIVARRVPGWAIAGSVGALVGVLVQVLQPGNRSRQALVDDAAKGPILRYVARVSGIADSMLNGTSLALLFAVALALCVVAWQRGYRRGLIRPAFCLAVATLAQCALILAPAFPGRTLCGATVVVCTAVVSAGRLAFAPTRQLRSAVSFLLVVSAALTALSVVQAVADSVYINRLNDRRIAVARNAGPDADVEVPAIRTGNPHVAWYGLTDWPDYYVAEWLGVKSVRTTG